MLRIDPIIRTSLTDSIIAQLREQIMSGRLKEGDKLPPERELAEMFKVGRTSVREALKAMEAMGLVKRERTGTVVKNPRWFMVNGGSWESVLRRASLHELFETRVMFEVRLAELAAERATEEDLVELEEAASVNPTDIDEFTRKDVGFHTALAEATQNQVLYQLYLAAREILFVSHKIYAAYEQGHHEEVMEVLKRAAIDHRKILDAVKRQDPKAAGQAMVEHLSAIEDMLQGLV